MHDPRAARRALELVGDGHAALDLVGAEQPHRRRAAPVGLGRVAAAVGADVAAGHAEEQEVQQLRRAQVEGPEDQGPAAAVDGRVGEASRRAAAQHAGVDEQRDAAPGLEGGADARFDGADVRGDDVVRHGAADGAGPPRDLGLAVDAADRDHGRRRPPQRRGAVGEAVGCRERVRRGEHAAGAVAVLVHDELAPLELGLQTLVEPRGRERAAGPHERRRRRGVLVVAGGRRRRRRRRRAAAVEEDAHGDLHVAAGHLQIHGRGLLVGAGHRGKVGGRHGCYVGAAGACHRRRTRAAQTPDTDGGRGREADARG